MLREKWLYQLKHISKSVGLSSDSEILSNYQFLNMVKLKWFLVLGPHRTEGRKID